MSMDVDTITDEQIAGIADRMTEEGRKVSPVTVWSEAQGGSIVAIAAALQRWREAHWPDMPPAQIQSGLPEDAAETMMSAAGRLWSAAHDEAQRAFGQRLSYVNHQLDAAFAERDEALFEYQRATEEVGAERERIIALTNALSAAESTSARLTEELASASGRAETAELRVDELVQRASEADARLAQTTAALEEERNARDELATIVMVKNEEIALANLERDEARQEAVILGDAVQQKSNTLYASENEVARLAAELHTVTGRAETAETRAEGLVQRTLDAEADLNVAHTTLDEERKAREELAAVVGSKNDEIARIAQERDDARQEVFTLSDAFQQKTNALSTAESEVARLVAELSMATGRAETAETRVEELVQRASDADARLAAAKATLAEECNAREALLTIIESKTEEIARIARDRDELIDLAASKGDEIARITQERDALNTAVASKSDEITRTAQERDEARREVTTLGNELEEKTNSLNASEVTASRLAGELGTATGRMEAAETRAAELERRASEDDARLELAKTSLDEERNAREELATVVTSQSDEIARIGQERDEVRREATNLRDAFKEKLSALSAAEETGTRLAAELATATTRADIAETRVAELMQHASEEGARLEQTKTSLDEERKAREVLDAAVTGKSEEIARIAEERDEVGRELATLSDTYQAKADEASRLSDEASAASSRAEAATTQANASLARLAALEAELDEARQTLAAERQMSAAGVDEVSVQRNELQRITRELDEARERVSAVSQAKTTADAELARIAQDASAARERADAAEQRAAELAQRIAKLNQARAAEAQSDEQPGIQAAESDPADDVVVLQRQISAQAKAHAKAFSELRANAEQWVAHAKELKQRLGQASEKVLFIDARSTGEVALVRRLSSELERLKPDHELVSRDVQQKLISTAMAQQLATKGYRYDPTTAVMSKVDG